MATSHGIPTPFHYTDVTMSSMASQITSLTIVYNRLFRRRPKKTSKLCVTGLCAGNSPVTGEFPAQMASNAENVPIWWRHHARRNCYNEEAYICCGYWCAILIAHQIVMAKHGRSCVHFSEISTCGRTSRETVSHPQCPPLPTLCKYLYPSTLLWQINCCNL